MLTTNIKFNASIDTFQIVSHSVVSDPVGSHGLWPARFLCARNSPSKKSGVDCHFLFQGIFPTQGSNLGLLHSRQILYRPSHCFLSIPLINCGRDSTSCSLAIWGFFSWTTSELHRIYYFHSGVKKKNFIIPFLSKKTISCWKNI